MGALGKALVGVIILLLVGLSGCVDDSPTGYYVLDMIDQNNADLNVNDFWARNIDANSITVEYTISENFIDLNVWNDANFLGNLEIDNRLLVNGDTNVQNIGVAGAVFGDTENGDLNLSGKIMQDGGSVIMNPLGNDSFDFIFGSALMGDSGDADNDERMFFDKSAAAFRGGKEAGSNWDSGNIGAFSFAYGNTVEATATASVAMGYGSNADQTYSFAMGYYPISSGNSSVAMGYRADATNSRAISLGNYTEATGLNSVALGDNSNATGENSFATGTETTASGTGSTAMGSFCTASGDYATALGVLNTAQGNGSLAFGYGEGGIVSFGSGSVVGGWDSGGAIEARGNASMAFGRVDGGIMQAVNEGSIALGYADSNHYAGGKGAISLGYNCIARGEASACIGKNLTNYKENSLIVNDINIVGDLFVGDLNQEATGFANYRIGYNWERTTVASAQYWGIGNGSQADLGVPVGYTGTVKRFQVACDTAGTSLTMSVHKNGADTSCDLTVGSSNLTVYSTDCDVDVGNGDGIAVYANVETGTYTTCVATVFVEYRMNVFVAEQDTIAELTVTSSIDATASTDNNFTQLRTNQIFFNDESLIYSEDIDPYIHIVSPEIYFETDYPIRFEEGIEIGIDGYEILSNGVDGISFENIGDPLRIETGDINADGTTHITENLFIDGNAFSDYSFIDNIWHAYGGFQSATEVIPLDQNVWTKITAWTTWDLWEGLESNGLNLVDDNMIFVNGGDYTGTVSITISGGNGDDYFIRLYNNTQKTQEGYIIGATTSGANNFVNITLPLYIEATAGDSMQMEIKNQSDGDDPTIRSAIFYLNYLHG